MEISRKEEEREREERERERKREKWRVGAGRSRSVSGVEKGGKEVPLSHRRPFAVVSNSPALSLFSISPFHYYSPSHASLSLSPFSLSSAASPLQPFKYPPALAPTDLPPSKVFHSLSPRRFFPFDMKQASERGRGKERRSPQSLAVK